jgi:hypothetical protein
LVTTVKKEEVHKELRVRGREREGEEENEKVKYFFEAFFHPTSAPNTGLTRPSSFPDDFWSQYRVPSAVNNCFSSGNLKCCVHDVMSLTNPCAVLLHDKDFLTMFADRESITSDHVSVAK